MVLSCCIGPDECLVSAGNKLVQDTTCVFSYMPAILIGRDQRSAAVRLWVLLATEAS